MSRVEREQSIEFTCVGECDDPPCWIVEGRFDADGEFTPVEVDDVGSDANCPECGERGEPTSEDVKLGDF